MLTLQETLWQLVRNKGRTLILVMASAMLAGCVAFYVSNITANEEAIERLAASIPVTVNVANPSADRTYGLNINAFRQENFLSSPYLEDFHYVIYGEGAYSEENRELEPFQKDCNVYAVSDLGCLWMPDGEFTYSQGYDESMFQSEEAVCLVETMFAERYDIEVGDEVTFPVYTLTYDLYKDSIYTPLGEQTLRVVGTSHSRDNPKEFLVPVNWMRKAMESKGAEVNYNEMWASMKDPRQISAFKDSIKDISFLEPNPDTMMDFTGATITVDDQQYITSAETLGQTVVLFKRFQGPFFALLIGMIILAIFLIMRGSRRVMAISISLGRPRFLCAAGCFLAALLAELAGCALVFPAMLLLAGLSIQGALTICGAFLLCACIGDVVALALLLRFNAFTLLAAVE
ncbi:hypothetical protein [Acutalibacter caecimuris]|uniref:hypothetical protein n=1 Tax=Acutalibacter caecimuris TaxID=3093657 RepID=UPI002AC89A57|nr:hypothetical protein [Acutalibacter sp. M00118]